MPVQQTIWSRELKETMKSVLARLAEIEQMPSDTIEQIKQKEKIYEIIMKILQRFKEVVDVYVSIYFENDVPSDEYSEMLQSISSADEEWDEFKQRYWFKSSIEVAKEKKFFHWELEFPEVFFEEGKVKENPGFDVVVGNPPWGVELDAEEKRYAHIADDTLSGPPESYRWFIRAGHNLTSNNSMFGMIVPNTWLSIPAAKALRRFIYSGSLLRTLVLVPLGSFEGVSMNTMIYTLEKREVEPDNVSSPIWIFIWTRLGDGSIRLIKEYEISRRDWGETPEYKIVIGQTPAEKQILRKASLLSIQLKKDFKVSLGLQAYHNTMHTQDEILKRIYHSSTPLDGTYMPEISGSNVSRYYLNLRPKEFISVGDWLYLVPEQRFLGGPRLLVLRITGGISYRIQTCYVEEVFAPYKAVLIVIPRETSSHSLHYLLAILNSTLATFFHHQYAEDATQDLFPTISITELNAFPIRRISFTIPEEERTTLLESFKSEYNANESDKILKIVEEYLPKDKEGNFITEKEKSDIIHDLLAFLAERMIELNKEKNEETKGFLEWLEREIKTEIDKLTNRTKLKAYYEREFDELLEILKKNKKKISITLSNRDFQDNLKKGFEKSKVVLSPLRNKIEATDKLIDQIVYKLYGLTDEEIKIVKSSLSMDNNENRNEESENE